MGSDIKDDIREFFHRLGLKPSGKDPSPAHWEALHKKVEAATGNPVGTMDFSDPMGEAVVDYFFTTADIAVDFLSADLPRLAQVLMALETFQGFPSQLKHVVEIGGGPGISSLWLAQTHPEARFTVFDHSENALAVGRAWAKSLGIEQHVRFEKTGYHDLALRKSSQRFDLILGLGALNLIIDDPCLSASSAPEPLKSSNVVTLHDFVAACRTLAAPDGLLYFSQGSFNDLGLLTLFKAFRQNHFGLDWQHTLCMGEGEGPAFSFKAIHIFARPERPSVFASAHEDLATFLYSAKMPRFTDKILLGYGDFESWLGLLSCGTKLADVRATQKDGRLERHTIYVNTGILGFFSTHSKGGRAGFIYAAAAFEATVSRLFGIVRQYREKNITLTKVYWHPYFEKRFSP